MCLQNSTPPRISFVEDVVDFLLQTLPEFWKLGQAYFNAELHVKPDKVKQVEFKVSYFLDFNFRVSFFFLMVSCQKALYMMIFHRVLLFRL